MPEKTSNTPAMTPNDTLMEQCRREAEERHRMSVYAEHRFVQTTDAALAAAIVEAKREAYAAALYAERSKPRTSLSVGEVMEIVEPLCIGEATSTTIRARLTAKINENTP